MKITLKNKLVGYSLILAVSVLSFSTKVHIDRLTDKVEALEKTSQLHTQQLKDLNKSLIDASKATEAMYNHSSVLDPSLLKAIIAVESSGNPNAYNERTGATGLMQITPIIFKTVCGLTKEEAFMPHKNIACGSMFFSHLLRKFNFNIERSLVYFNSGNAMNNPKYARLVMNKLKGNK